MASFNSGLILVRKRSSGQEAPIDQRFVARLANERRVLLSVSVASGNSALTSFASAGLILRMTRPAHG